MIINIKNVLTNKKRKQLIEDCQPLLYDSDQLRRIYNPTLFYAGKQTLSNLQFKPQFQPIITYFVDIICKESGLDLELQEGKCWINSTDGKKENINWHVHTSDYAVVYYIKTLPFFNNGTLFRNGFIKAPQNSLLIFPAHLEHSAPTCPFQFERYTLSFNLNIVR